MFASPNSHPKSASHVPLGGGGLLRAENRKYHGIKYFILPIVTASLLQGYLDTEMKKI